MKLLLYLLVIISITFIVIILNGLIFRSRGNIMARLKAMNELFYNPEDENELLLPFDERIIKPVYQKIVSFIGKSTPRQITENIGKNLLHAGSPGNMTINRFLAIQFMLATILVGIFYLMFNFRNMEASILLLVLLGIIGFMLPLYVLRGMVRKRQTEIQKALPSVLDLLFVSVEAGLGFDMALKRTIEKMEGPLSDEFKRALDEINKGKERGDALRGIVLRTGVDDLSSFIAAVIQSEQLGSNIANMLRIQSTSMRQKRRQKAEQLAMKVPIKMLFPLVFFMFPALFIVILGPAVIRIVGIFADMF